MHLRDPQPRPDLRLRHIPVKPHQHNPLLPPRQLPPVRPHRQHPHHPLHPRILITHHITHAPATIPPGRRIQRPHRQHQLGRPRRPHLTHATTQKPRHLTITRHPPQPLRQHPRRLPHRQHQFLHRPFHPHLPPLIAEMPLNLPADRRLRIRRQRTPHLGIKIIDRLHQPHIPHLHQILRRLRTPQIPPHTRPDQTPVPPHQNLTCRCPPLVPHRQRPHHTQQRRIRQPAQPPTKARGRGHARDPARARTRTQGRAPVRARAHVRDRACARLRARGRTPAPARARAPPCTRGPALALALALSRARALGALRPAGRYIPCDKCFHKERLSRAAPGRKPRHENITTRSRNPAEISVTRQFPERSTVLTAGLTALGAGGR